MVSEPKQWFRYFRDFIRIFLILLIFSTIASFWYINQQRDYYQEYITHATELRVLTQEIDKYSNAVTLTSAQPAFSNLKDAYGKVLAELDILKNGKKSLNKVVLPPTPLKIKEEELSRFLKIWESVTPNIDVILYSEDATQRLTEISQSVLDKFYKMREDYATLLKEVQKENEVLVKISEQLQLINEITNRVEKNLMLSTKAASLGPEFFSLMAAFIKNAEWIMQLPSIAEERLILASLEAQVKPIQEDIDSLLKINPSIDKIRKSLTEMSTLGPLIASLAKHLEDAYVLYPEMDNTPEFSAYILGFLSFLVLIIAIYHFHKETEMHFRIAEERNILMQSEVEKLLNELPEIAGGHNDLIQPETHHSLSGIADSFTYALNTLRKLVYNIGKTARNVSEAAVDAQAITKELATSSGHQAQEIVEVTASVNAMALSIEQVSANASESASVALESVNIAGEGGEVVRGTIHGMERIQTQIQETSNYMRRLSESSQEIGEIVSLIEGIADQTNILSLNASIQAAMAGEAGRGFAVVADEVQRLAEKVSYATKEIGSLVRSIQLDTNQVIVAMEQTKSQVQEGVNSAQAAGSTLEKIERVSRRLSDLIQNISASASTQALASGKISHIMNDVKEIAKNTASGNLSTVDRIGKLMQYVNDLRNSVFEFKLPQRAKKEKI